MTSAQGSEADDANITPSGEAKTAVYCRLLLHSSPSGYDPAFARSTIHFRDRSPRTSQAAFHPDGEKMSP